MSKPDALGFAAALEQAVARSALGQVRLADPVVAPVAGVAIRVIAGTANVTGHARLEVADQTRFAADPTR
jgi:uncharacterized alkaline shock family protein YloU